MRAGSFNSFKKDNGFTMVELLIVIIIIAVLTAIAIPSYIIINNRAKETATETEMNNIAKALEIYITDKHLYPSQDDFPDALKTAEIMTNFSGNDTWGIAYNYTSDSGSYALESYGLNKVNGGNDDIVFINGIMTEDGAYPNH